MLLITQVIFFCVAMRSFIRKTSCVSSNHRISTILCTVPCNLQVSIPTNVQEYASAQTLYLNSVFPMMIALFDPDYLPIDLCQDSLHALLWPYKCRGAVLEIQGRLGCAT